jgi:FkbM family methyltransferase
MMDWLTRLVPALYRNSGASRLFRLPAADPLFLAAFFAYKRLAEDPFAALAARRPELFRGGDILDVGANAGYTSAVFGRALTPGARVHAFEPEPINLRRLRRVIGRRRLEGIVIPHAVAVGARDGSIELAVSETHPGDHRVAVEGERDLVVVPMRSLDSFAAECGIDRVAFIKIDVQGYELEVSRGMAALLDRSPAAAVAFEYAPPDMRRFGFDPVELVDFYRRRGFALFHLAHDGALAPFSDAAVERPLERRGYVDVLALPGLLSSPTMRATMRSEP